MEHNNNTPSNGGDDAFHSGFNPGPHAEEEEWNTVMPKKYDQEGKSRDKEENDRNSEKGKKLM
eukprot:6448657-Ditylum_brightwellii.AAC.1